MIGNYSTSKYNKPIAIVILIFIIGILAFESVFFNLKTLSAFSIINTFVVMMIIFKIRNSIFSISSMFMLFLSVFHFGQAWLYVFDIEVDEKISYDIFSLYPAESIYAILLFSLLAYNFIALFLIVFSKKNSMKLSKVRDLQNEKSLSDKKMVLRFYL